MKHSQKIAFRQIMSHIDIARHLFAQLPKEGEHFKDLCVLENNLIDAQYHGLNLLESIRVMPPEGFAVKDAEPLNADEEAKYYDLQRLLRFNDNLFSALTEEQKFSAARVINRQGLLVHPVGFSGTKGDMLGLSFEHIFIGVEGDGYAHS